MHLPIARIAVLLFVLVGCANPAPRGGMPTAQPPDLAIRGVTVVDVEAGTLLPDRTVLIRGNRIVAVESGTGGRLPAGTLVVDGRGKYLIPGLWDMHVHTVKEDADEGYAPFFPLFVANGVTGVRDTWGDLGVARALRHRMREGTLLGPRLVVAGNLVDGAPAYWPRSVTAATPEQGRAVVDSLVQAGAAFVKVYSRLSAETYMAIAQRAREVGIPFAGHVPFVLRAADASDVGQRSMEHLYGVLEGCSSEEHALITEREVRRRAQAAGDAVEPARDFLRRRLTRILSTQDEARCRELLARFAANTTWQVPTLVMIRGSAFMMDPGIRADPRLRFLRRELIASWEEVPDWDFPTEQAIQARGMAVVGLMAKTDVPLLAGSDTPNPYALPGFGLHDELELLVEAGLTPLQALQAATLNAARYLEATDSLGTVAPGKLADLVLLDANPLDDIRNTTRIRAVVVNGRLLDRAALDALLEGIRRAALEAPAQ